MAFDPGYPQFNESIFKEADWGEMYPDAKEQKIPKMPEPLGKPVTMTCFFDAAFAGDLLNRRSRTGIIIYLNKAPMLWFSKSQNTVETSTFSSELVAMRQAVDMIEALRYKVRMFGIPLEESTVVFGDNEAVINNVVKPEGALKKKHVSICYHRCREAQAGGWIRTAWIPSEFNVADVLSKRMNAVQRKGLLCKILW